MILQHETGVTKVVDPLAGSYYVESLTQQLADEAWKLMEEVEAIGGMTKAVEDGLPKRRIEEAATRKQAGVDKGDTVIVGVNKYRLETEDEIDILQIDNTAVRKSQIERLERTRSQRDPKACEAALKALEDVAQSGQGNILEAAVVAARARASVGEISDALEKAFARHKAVPNVVSGVYAEAYGDDPEYNTLVQRLTDFAKDLGEKPRLMVAKLGQDGHDRGAKVIASAFGDIGYEVIAGELFETPAEAAQSAINHKVHVIGASSLAAGHKTLLPELVEELKKRSAENIIVITGGVIPRQDYDYLKERGVAAIFGPGTNVLEAARGVLDLIEGKLSNR